MDKHFKNFKTTITEAISKLACEQIKKLLDKDVGPRKYVR